MKGIRPFRKAHGSARSSRRHSKSGSRSREREHWLPGLLKMIMFLVWPAIVVLIAILAAVIGFTDIAPTASEGARVTFYLIVALVMLLLVTGLLLLQKATSFARGFGINVSARAVLGVWKWVQFLRKGRGMRR